MNDLIEVARKGFIDGVRQDFETPKLDNILSGSKEGLTYRSHSNGFYLGRNHVRPEEDLRLDYVYKTNFNANVLELWFLNTNPKICFSAWHFDYVTSTRIDTDNIPGNLNCNMIQLHTGSTNEFNDHNTLQINKNPLRISPNIDGKLIIHYEWFKEGTRLMQEATEKYQFKSFYDIWKEEIRMAPKDGGNIKRVFGQNVIV